MSSATQARPHSSPDVNASAPRGVKQRPFSSDSRAYGKDAVFPGAPKTASFSRWSASKCWSMGTKLSNLNSIRSNTPGPGAYSPGYNRTLNDDGNLIDADIVVCRLATLTNAPRYSISPRLEQKGLAKLMALVPGPGAYVPINPKHKPRSVALGQKLTYGDPSKPPTDPSRVTPGPGQYDIVEATSFSDNKTSKGGMRTAPMWTFGKRTPHVTGSLVMNTTPGPGSYIAENRVDRGPSYTINPRLPRSKTYETPGPGAYDISYGTTYKGKAMGPSSSIHSRLSPTQPSNAVTPGPGRYEAPQQFWISPSMMIRSRSSVG